MSHDTATPYRTPSPDVIALVDAPPTPIASVSPDHRRILHLHYTALPSIKLVAAPFLKLAGVRLDPRTNAQRQLYDFTHLEIQDLHTLASHHIHPPEGCARLAAVSWSPDGQRIAISGFDPHGALKLWLCDLRTLTTRPILHLPLADTLAGAFRWMGGSSQLLLTLIPPGRPAPPAPPDAPLGPIISETGDAEAQNRTWQDLLESPHDEALFEHYMTVQLAALTLDDDPSGAADRLDLLGAPCIARRVQASPDARFLLVHALHRPWSYDVPYAYFPHTVQIWDAKTGETLHTLASLPLFEDIPIEGVPRGPRRVAWQPTAPATLCWAEALDEGDPRRAVDHRDRILRLAAPFTDAPQEVLRVKERLNTVAWLDTPAPEAWVTEYDRDRRWVTTRHVCFDDPDPHATARLLFDRSARDVYNDPGSPLTRVLPHGDAAVALDPHGHVWLAGAGATPQGYRPFLDRFHPQTAHTTRVFQATPERFSKLVGFGPDTPHGPTLVLREEDPATPPNYTLHTPHDGARTALTAYPDPHPQLTGIRKQLLTYTRPDGVPLSGTLYLPPTYQEGQRLPLLLWAYPLEYNDAQTAGQVRAAPNTFTRLQGTSPLMFLTQGYAVLLDATIPIVGDPATMNDTFIPQLQAAAQAAIDACDALGVIDRTRVIAAGHSYGAFMVANLLAHTDLFCAGIARSGAYNRSLTPFGFQSERRTLWEAPDTYIRLSPFFHAHKIQAPLLLIHGDLDNNPGTLTLQTKRLFHALKGLGKKARMVILPGESHGYQARESVLHVLAECFETTSRFAQPEE